MRTTTTLRYSNAQLGALAYAGSSHHHVQIGIFAVSGTTDTKLALHSRDAAGNNKQTYLVYTFTDRASQCKGSAFPGPTTDGTIRGGREMRTQAVRTAPSPTGEESIPLQGGWVTLTNHTAQQASGKHLCVELKFHRENHSSGQSEQYTFSY